MHADPIFSVLSNIGPMELIVLALFGLPLAYVAWIVMRSNKSDGGPPQS